jgi:competence protein ComEC
MQTLKLLIKRPVITLTLAYIAILILLKSNNFLEPKKPSLYFNHPENTCIVEGIITTPPEIYNNNLRFALETKAKDTIIVSINNKHISSNLEAGDFVALTGKYKDFRSATNEGEFNYAQYMSYKDIFLAFQAKSYNIVSRNNLNWIKRLSFKIRKSILNSINTNFKAEEADILSKMLIGYPSYINNDLRTKFTNAGVMHLLVVSGFNVAYVIITFLVIFRLIGLNKRTASILSIPFIILYTVLTGANPPIVRACIMGIYIVLAYGIKRDPGIYQSLSLACLTILVLDYHALFSASFLLSFAATLGIVYFYPIFSKPFEAYPKYLKYLLDLFLVSFSAQLIVSPIIALYFNKVCLIGLISNILLVPLAGIVTTTGVIFYLGNLIFSNISILTVPINHYLLKTIYFLTGYFASFKYAVIRVPAPSTVFIVCYYIFFWAIFKLKKTPKMALVLSLAVIMPVAQFNISNYKLKDELKVTFLDVGYGDCVHIHFPNGKNYLIDCGASFNPYFDVGERIISPYLWKNGVSKIDKLIITNFSLPRYGNLQSILKNFKVEEIITSPGLMTDPAYINIMAYFRDNNIYFRKAWTNDAIYEGDVHIRFISPVYADKSKYNNSLVMLIEYNKNTVLFTGDITYKLQKHLALSSAVSKCSVLVMPMHARTELNEEFLDKTSPDYLIASKGKKTYYDKEDFLNYKLYSTSENGSISFTFYKDKPIKIDTFKNNTQM